MHQIQKSTSAGVIRLGNRTIKTWSTNQAAIALSSGEAEYYALVKSARMAIGICGPAQDTGVEYDRGIRLNTDASAAIGISNRVGSGKVRHIEVNQLWLQEKAERNGVGDLADRGKPCGCFDEWRGI